MNKKNPQCNCHRRHFNGVIKVPGQGRRKDERVALEDQLDADRYGS